MPTRPPPGRPRRERTIVLNLPDDAAAKRYDDAVRGNRVRVVIDGQPTPVTPKRPARRT